MALFGTKELEAKIEALKEENKKLYQLGKKQAEDIRAEVTILLSEIKSLKATNQKQAEALKEEKNKHAQLNDTSDTKLKEVQSESELLLLQLHQVQEELESVFLKEQEAQNQIQALNQSINLANQDKFNLNEVKTKLEQEKTTLNETIATLLRDKGALSQDKTTLTEERDKERQLALERQTKIDSLSQLVDGKLKEVEDKKDALQKELDASKQTIETLNQEKTKDHQDKINFNQSIAKLTEEKTTLTTQLGEQTKLANERQTKIDSMAKLIDGQLKEVQEENELLLLQLHQVQEELEHHFLEHQKLQRESDSFKTRWLRLEEREPQYLDYASVMPIVVDTVSAKPKLDWRASDITIQNEVIPEFLFTTFLEDGMPGIEMTHQEEGSDPIRLVPRSLIKPDAQKALAQYRNMSMRGWQSLASGIKAIEQFFKSPKRASQNQKLPDFFDLVFWRQSLIPLVADFKSLPAVFRFNEVKLKREQINPDYEHLWLEFDGASFGNYHWPTLEIRFAAANVQPGGFSRRPKVEIPKIGGTKVAFDTWFEESQDDFGPKMELRFDLNKQFFDLDVWSRVSPEDRSMLISLIGGIPFALKKMEDVGTKIARPWEDWNLLASGMVEILRRIITEAEKLAREAKEQDEAKKLGAPVPNETIEVGNIDTKDEDDIKLDVKETEVASTEPQKDSVNVARSNQATPRFGKKKKR